MDRRSQITADRQGFPFRIYKTGRLAEIEKHDHDFWEVVYVYEGQGDCTVGARTYEFQSRQLIFTPPFVPHRFSARPHTFHSQVSIAVYEQFLKRVSFLWPHFTEMFVRIVEASCFSVVIPDEHAPAIESRIEAIYRESLFRPRNHEAGIVLDLARLLLDADRFLFGGREAFFRLGEIPLVVRRALETIETSYPVIRGLDDIRHGIKIDWRYFIRVFRKHVGQTPIHYLNAVRIEKCADLLLHTRQPVVQIAVDAGFNDLSYFNRRFKSMLGVTPTEFRRQAPKNTALSNRAKRFPSP